MPSMTLRQLRDTRLWKSWLQAGETVELREQNRILGRIVPEPAAKAPEEWPDFESPARAIFGDRMIPAADQPIEDRGDSRY
jgi:hypothetical protein